MGTFLKYFRAIIAVAAWLALSAGTAAAQYFSLGDDPGGTRWQQLSTPYYDVIYPRGMDSLAYDYALNLEKYRPLSLWGMSAVGKRQNRISLVNVAEKLRHHVQILITAGIKSRPAQFVKQIISRRVRGSKTEKIYFSRLFHRNLYLLYAHGN